ncbi:MAG: TlpA family protein disulfide reductase [Pyrinomonadaceae bacterium]|nr:TlpA family protein disulfide reductase [Pyrinomonadaceae bacterium]
MSMRIGDEMPTFEGATEFLNGELNLETGKPTLVHFWATSCGICKEKMPQLREMIDSYGEKGLQTVAIHMPRYEADTNMETVRETVEKQGITEVCAVDNEHKLKDAFKNEQGWVPVYYLFNEEGKLKSRAAGEFGVGVLKTALEKMFAEETNKATA